MHVISWLVCLVATVVAVTAVSRRLDLSPPVVMVAVGVGASYLPFVPDVRLTPELVLMGLLPPLLYNAALQTSLIDFKAHRRAILSLSVGLVAFTTAGVAVVVHAVVPGLDWPSAFAIGAVVAPPDAVAATAVARRIGLPRPVVTILEGESLLNDATALVALKTAALAAAGAATITGVTLDFVRASIGGVACGVVVYLAVGWVRRHVRDPVMDTCVSLVTPFIAYVLAEELEASGVLAVVVAGLLLGHRAPVLQTASSRIAEQLNWRTISFLLENAVFLLIGMQTRPILDSVLTSGLPTSTVVGTCAAVLAAVIVLRMAWVFPSRYLLSRAQGFTGRRPPARYTAVVGWAGMRGVVTLAAAFAIPADAAQRELLVLVALVVTAGTLVLQGLSLPWVVRRLGVPGPDPRQDALARAELLQQASQAGLARLQEIDLQEGAADVEVRDLLRSKLEQRDFAAWERLGQGDPAAETPSELYTRLRLDMLDAERRRVLELRSEGRLPHDVVADVLTTLDVEESMIGRVVRQQEAKTSRDGEGDGHRRADACAHLVEAGPGGPPADRRCEDCVREGTTWVHLRTCIACGHVGCCDSSPRRHASGHFHGTGHPVVVSAEPGEDWRWCFVDELLG